MGIQLNSNATSLTQREVQDLESLLKKELKLYKDYEKLIDRERDNVVNFDAEKVVELTLQREQIFETLSSMQVKRMEIVGPHLKRYNLPLTQWLEKYGSVELRQRLLPLATTLKSTVRECREKIADFGQLLNFALTMVSGTVSILWSGTQDNTSTYSANSLVVDSGASQRSRNGNLIQTI